MEEDWISKLKLHCDKEKISLPPYSLAQVPNQPDHAPLFVGKIKINGSTYVSERTHNKKQAKQMTARCACVALKVDQPQPEISSSCNNKEAVVVMATSSKQQRKEPTSCAILVDVDNFPLFIYQTDKQVISSRNTTVYAFTSKPINSPPTGVIVIEAKKQPITPRTTHAYMSAYLGGLLATQSIEEERCLYVIVAGDKLATELVNVVKDDSLGWEPQEAVHCKKTHDLLLLFKK